MVWSLPTRDIGWTWGIDDAPKQLERQRYRLLGDLVWVRASEFPVRKEPLHCKSYHSKQKSAASGLNLSACHALKFMRSLESILDHEACARTVPLIADLERGRVLKLAFAPVVEAGRRNVGVPEPLLHRRNVCCVRERISCGGCPEGMHADDRPNFVGVPADEPLDSVPR